MPTTIFNSVVAARFDPDNVNARIETVLGHFRRGGRPDPSPGTSGRPPRRAFSVTCSSQTVSCRAMTNRAWPSPSTSFSRTRVRTRPLRQRLIIEPVRTEDDLGDWVDVWLFPVPEADRRLFFDALRYRALSVDAPWRYYVGRLDGRPVATVELFIDAGVASVQYVVTLPEQRRRGIGAAMTRHVLWDAHKMGCRIAVLTASPDGFGIYHRLGFREHCRIQRYEWEPGKARAADVHP